jgi:hypothetical protein
MLNFITTKKDQRFEYRYYIESSENIEGVVIYKGHKLGLNDDILANILDYRIERMGNKIYLLDYNSNGNWFSTTITDTKTVLDKSYESLQQKAENRFGKFRKIVVTRV